MMIANIAYVIDILAKAQQQVIIVHALGPLLYWHELKMAFGGPHTAKTENNNLSLNLFTGTRIWVPFKCENPKYATFLETCSF